VDNRRTTLAQKKPHQFTGFAPGAQMGASLLSVSSEQVDDEIDTRAYDGRHGASQGHDYKRLIDHSTTPQLHTLQPTAPPTLEWLQRQAAIPLRPDITSIPRNYPMCTSFCGDC
jgi:hypothetical protein